MEGEQTASFTDSLKAVKANSASLSTASIVAYNVEEEPITSLLKGKFMIIKNFFKDVIHKMASLFKSLRINKKIHELMLNCFVAEKDEYYSYDEPSPEKMENKTFWIQIVDKEDEQ